MPDSHYNLDRSRNQVEMLELLHMEGAIHEVSTMIQAITNEEAVVTVTERTFLNLLNNTKVDITNFNHHAR